MREIKFEPAPPSGSAGHLPMNGEDLLRHLPMKNGEDPLSEAPEYA